MLIDLLKSYFKEQEWQFSELDDKNVFFLGISGQNGKIQCIASIDEKESKFAFYSICGSNAPEEKRREMAELLIRLNYSMFLGNFDMDFEDGEIRYKTSINYKHVNFNDDLFKQYILLPIQIMDEHLPVIMNVMYGGLAPNEAINIFETQQKEDMELLTSA